MKLKMVEVNGKKYAEVDESGNPVYVYGDGKELGFDVAATVANVNKLNSEAAGHRRNKEELEGKLAAYKDVPDAAAALEALNTVKNLSAGDLVKADKVEEIKREAKKAAETQVAEAAKASAKRIAELEKERDGFRDGLYSEKVGGRFSRSKYIEQKVAVPSDMIQAMFGKNFKVEGDGHSVVPYDAAGNKIYSRVRPGEVADFDEGLEILIDSYPNKQSILKGTGANGSGGQGGHGGPAGDGNRPTMSRAEFSKLGPAQAASTIKSHHIVD